MNPFAFLKPLLGGLAKRFLPPDKDAALAAQNRINELEAEKAPPSHLQSWRGFLMWCVALMFVFELVARPILTTYFPHLPLPAIDREAIVRLLFGGMGLGL